MNPRLFRRTSAVLAGIVGVLMAMTIPPITIAGSSGVIVYERISPDGVTDLWTMDADGGDQALFFADAADADVSPDGRLIAFDRASLIEPPDIYVVGTDGTGLVQLTDEPGFDFWPDWSPDGKQMTFTSDRGGNSQIYVMDADGSNVERLTNEPGHGPQGSVYSPNGQRIVFVSGAVVPTIAVMNADGTGAVVLTAGPDLEPSWSPDGQQIAFVSVRDGVREIYVMDADGGDQTRLTNDANRDIGPPVFSPSGDEIAFMSRRAGNFDIYAISLKDGSQRRLTTDPAVEGFPEWRQGVLVPG